MKMPISQQLVLVLIAFLICPSQESLLKRILNEIEDDLKELQEKQLSGGEKRLRRLTDEGTILENNRIDKPSLINVVRIVL